MRLILCFLLLTTSFAFKLTRVQGISKTGQTFITRTGKADGVQVGQKSTFTNDNVSIIAEAITVTRRYTQWEILNDKTAVPFETGEVVTYYDTTEYIWALAPEEVKEKYVKSRRYDPAPRFMAQGGLMQGLSSSTSEAATSDANRGAYWVEAQLEKDYSRHIAFAGGVRYAREIINVTAASLVQTQLLAIADIRYYFRKMPDFFDAKFGLGVGIGYGNTQTTTDGATSTGQVLLMPRTTFSMSLPMSKKYEFITTVSLEAMQVREDLSNNDEQTSNNSNAMFGVGLVRTF